MPEDAYPKVYLYRRIVRAKLYMDRHYAEDLDLDNISDEACYSKYHFIRLFKRIYGETPHRYLTAVRVDEARKLLKDGHSVTDVCFAVGFESVSSFTGLFKRMIGRTPSAFQEKEQHKQEVVRQAPLSVVPRCFASARGWLGKRNFEEAAV